MGYYDIVSDGVRASEHWVLCAETIECTGWLRGKREKIISFSLEVATLTIFVLFCECRRLLMCADCNNLPFALEARILWNLLNVVRYSG